MRLKQGVCQTLQAERANAAPCLHTRLQVLEVLPCRGLRELRLRRCAIGEAGRQWACKGAGNGPGGRFVLWQEGLT